MSRVGGWLRRNRWWLVVLPVAIALMVAASSYRVRTFWWESGLHRELASAGAGEEARVVEEFDDGLGLTRRSYAVRAGALQEVDEVTLELDPGPVPDGLRAYRVPLDFEAAPDQDLQYCRVLLVDDAGVRYGGELSDLLRQANLCLPEGRGGPARPLGEGDRRGVVPAGAERPETWSVSPVVLVPEDARPTRVWITFEAPDYVSLGLPR